MKLKNYSIIGAILTITGCANTSGVYKNPMQNLQDISINEVRGYAVEMGAYYAKNGQDKSVKIAKEIAKNNLKDPDSANFQNVRVTDYDSGKVVCGEINAKNSYGGYVGYKKFVAGVTGATLWTTSSKYQNVNDASNLGITMACGY